MEVATYIDSKYLQSLYEKEEAQAEVLKLQFHLQQVLKHIYGSKSERFVSNPSQLTLDIVPETPAPATDLSKEKKIEYVRSGEIKKRNVPDLMKYIQYLDKVYETREPENIPANAIKIGEQEQVIIEHTPGKLFARIIVTPIYKIPVTDQSEKTQIISAPTPERPLAKCLAGSSLLAQMLVDKFCDHLPLHRIHKRFERNGVFIPYNTTIDWMGKSIELLSVLGPPLQKEIIQSFYIHVDETGLKVLLGKESNKVKKIHDGYLWCYHDSINKLVYFDYQPRRGEKHTIGILKDFHGILQTDGWHVYEGIAAKQKDIIQICCPATPANFL